MLMGCSEPTASDRSHDRLAALERHGEWRDFDLAPRFRIQLEVAGEISPNSPIRLTARTTGLISTQDVDIRISAPEIEAARTSAWGSGFRVPTRVSMPALQSSRTSLSAGASDTRTIELSVPAPGYYRVVASARAVQEPLRAAGKLRYEDAAHATVWLFVSESDGRTTRRFDATLLPDSAVRRPGPLRYLRPSQPEPGRAATDAIMSSPGSRTWEVIYYDDYWNQYEPLVGATVTGTEGPAGEDPTSVYETTNIDGEFVTGCDDELFYGYNMEVNAANTALIVIPNSVVATVNASPWGCGDEQIIVDHDAEAHVFSHTRIAISNSLDFFDQGRVQVPVKVDTAASYSYYDYAGDTIVIKSSLVFSLAVEEITAHEFGHSLHHEGFEGLAGPPFCQVHGLPAYTTLKCAYDEGFAAYHAAVTRPDVLTGLADDLEDNAYLLVNSNPDGSNPNDPDGSVIEGAVAAFLFDLTDGANETHDAVSFPGSYVADVMRTCFVGDGVGVPIHADGIDHFIRCLEKQVDSGINGYFYYRSPASTTQSESASEPGSWNLTNIRTLWKKNLFDI